MQSVVGKTLNGEVVNLDDTYWKDCHFKECVLVYAGGHTVLQACHIDTKCQMHFVGAAQDTVSVLNSIGFVEVDERGGLVNLRIKAAAALKEGEKPC